MRTISKEKAIKILLAKNVSCFSVVEAKRVFYIKNFNTLYKMLQRLANSEIIKRVNNGRYIFLIKKPSDFELANFIISPSYISLESALSFYGILSQFPYTITSMSLKKTKRVNFEDKEFEYSQINKKYFFGFEKIKNNMSGKHFLIASREKALLDLLYLFSKKQRVVSLEELDLKKINMKHLIEMAEIFNFRPLQKVLSKI